MLHIHLSGDVYESRRAAIKWWGKRALVGIFYFWISLFFFLPPIQYFLGRHFDAPLLEYIGDTVLNMVRAPWIPFRDWGRWLAEYALDEPRHTTWASFFIWRSLLLPTFGLVFYLFWMMVKNPHYFIAQVAGDHEATADDLKKMGLLGGQGLFVGMSKGKKLKLPDARSVLCIGAPMSGKTTGVMIPAIFELNEASMIVNDPKGELSKLTSGHRATLGPVFVINWGRVDDKKTGVRYPSWNPIGGGNLPALHEGRESYIDGLVYFLIPDGPKGADPYWVLAGRGCLTGLTGYICGKVEQARANDYFLQRVKDNTLDDEDYAVLLSYYKSMRDFPEVLKAIQAAESKAITADNYLPIGHWEGIPKMWQGRAACFAMLLDMITQKQAKLSADLRERKSNNDSSAWSFDPWHELFEEIVLETAYYGYGRRTLLELNQVESLPDKQRGSVISMALSGINIFKNSAIRERTSTNDLNYDQLRGIKDKQGKYRPVTVYMSVPYEDLGSSLLVSTLFINMAAGYLSDIGPGDDGCGPYPMGFMLDEFQHMPSLQSISDGIVFGRMKKNMFFLNIQDWNQISAKYNEDTKDIILSSVAAKIVKRQNNEKTRMALLKGSGTVTKVTHSYSRDAGNKLDFSGKEWIGLGKGESPINLWHPVKHGVKYTEDNLVGGAGIMSMAMDKQLVLYTGALNRPIRADTPLYFKDPAYQKLAAIKPAPNIPDDIVHPEDVETDEIQLD